MNKDLSELIERAKNEAGTDEFRVSIVFLPYGNDALIEKSKRFFRKVEDHRYPLRRTMIAGFEKKDKLDGDETYNFRIDGELYTFSENKMKEIHDCFKDLPFVCRKKFQFVSFRVKNDEVVQESVYWIKGRLNVYLTFHLMFCLEDDLYNTEENEKRFLHNFPSYPALNEILSIPAFVFAKMSTINYLHYRWKRTELVE